MKRLLFSAFLLALLNIRMPIAWTAPGELDTSFDGDGISFITFADLYPGVDSLTSSGRGVFQASDGSIYVAGLVTATIVTPPSTNSDFTLSRLNSSGGLDSSFGNGGRIMTDFLPNYSGPITLSADVATAMAQRPDGKIVLCGNSFVIVNSALVSNFAVSVYNPDGSLDSSFNPNGPLPGTLVIEPDNASSFSSANAVAIQDDNKILLAGLTVDPTNFFDFTILRLNTDGSLDTSFNPSGSTPGVLVLNFLSTPSVEVPLSIVYNSDTGEIYVGGTGAFEPSQLLDFALVKLASDGSLVDAFGNHGIANTDVLGASQDVIYSLQLQSSGQVVAAGSTNTSVSALRYQASNGAVDSGFGDSGLFNTDGIDGSNASITVTLMNSAIQADDSVFIVGKFRTGIDPTRSEIALVKLLSNGQQDTSFNPAGAEPGLVHTNITGSSSSTVNVGKAAAVQSDGKVLVAGDSSALGSGGQQVVLRYLGNTADLSIQKAAASYVSPNSSFDFTITVQNAGPDSAGGVTITDALPDGLQLDSATPSQGSCEAGPPLTCNLGLLEANASASVTVTVTATSSNVFENTAIVSGQSIDGNNSNNSSTATVTVLSTQGGSCALAAPGAEKPAIPYAYALCLSFLVSLRFTRKFRFLT